MYMILLLSRKMNKDRIEMKQMWSFPSIKKTRATVIHYSCLDVSLKIVELYERAGHALTLNLLKFALHLRAQCTYHQYRVF